MARQPHPDVFNVPVKKRERGEKTGEGRQFRSADSKASFQLPLKGLMENAVDNARVRSHGELQERAGRVPTFNLRGLPLIPSIKGKEFSAYTVTQQPKLKALITAVIT